MEFLKGGWVRDHSASHPHTVVIYWSGMAWLTDGWQLAIGGTASPSSSGSFSSSPPAFLAVVRRLSCFQLRSRQVGPVGRGHGK